MNDAGRRNRAGGREYAGRDIHRDNGLAARVDLLRRVAVHARQRVFQPCAEHCVHNHSAGVQRVRRQLCFKLHAAVERTEVIRFSIAFERRGIGQQNAFAGYAAFFEQAQECKTVPAIVAACADGKHRQTRIPLGKDVVYALRRAFHPVEALCRATFEQLLLKRAHLFGGNNALHASSSPPSACSSADRAAS